MFLYIHNEILERGSKKKKKKKQQNLIQNHVQKNYLGVNLTKEVKDLYAENHKIFIKETENNSKKSSILGWKNQYC